VRNDFRRRTGDERQLNRAHAVAKHFRHPRVTQQMWMHVLVDVRKVRCVDNDFVDPAVGERFVQSDIVDDRVNLTDSCGVIPLMTIATIDRTVWVEEDKDQLVRFVEADYGSLVAALGLVCGDRAAAEDAVQEALARAMIALRKGATIDSLSAWVRLVALNLLRNRWRSLARERQARRRMENDPSTSVFDGIEDALDLQTAIAALSRRQREAVALYYRLGLSVTETAQTMKVSDGTVKTLLSRARTSLAAALGSEEVPYG
jgi:RNA polymerase sigma factor (sigma-70 family)